MLLEMIKFRHSIFALPFALTAMLAAADGLPRWQTIFWIVAACVAARTMAMAYNRLADRDIDARNPRTRDRALPAGLLSEDFTKGFIAASALVFVFASAMLNFYCLALSPVAIAILIGYSHCKRFTRSAHYVLGLALAIAPLGAWIAVRGSFEGLPVLLGLGVLFWTAGFDIIYSCLDAPVDRRDGLFSLPAKIGIGPALHTARAAHFFSALCLALFLTEMRFGPWAWTAWLVCSALMVFEHRLVRPGDLSKVGPAFFTFNALVSFLFFLGCALETLLPGS